MNPTAEFRSLVLAALAEHEGDLQAQADAVSDVTWRYVEKTCRPHPWPPPRRVRVDEAKAKARQQRQDAARRTA